MLNDPLPGVPGSPALTGAMVLPLAGHRLFSTVAAVFRTVAIAAGILAALLVVLVMFFAFRKPKAKPAGASGGEDAKILAKGRSDLLELRQLNMRLKNRQIRSRSEEICSTVDKILQALREQPEDIPKARHFFQYYLPTMGEILRKYRILEDSGVPASDTEENVASCLEVIQTAMEKQYVSLFDDDKLDLTVEIEVLKQMGRRDGLLTDDDFEDNSGEQGITLRR